MTEVFEIIMTLERVNREHLFCVKNNKPKMALHIAVAGREGNNTLADSFSRRAE